MRFNLQEDPSWTGTMPQMCFAWHWAELQLFSPKKSTNNERAEKNEDLKIQSERHFTVLYSQGHETAATAKKPDLLSPSNAKMSFYTPESKYLYIYIYISCNILSTAFVLLDCIVTGCLVKLNAGEFVRLFPRLFSLRLKLCQECDHGRWPLYLTKYGQRYVYQSPSF